MTNPLPPATHEFCDETVDMAEVTPLAVDALRVHLGQHEPISFPTGAHGSVVVLVRQPDRVSGPDGEHTVWMNGDELACSCGRAGCVHVAAVQSFEPAGA